MPRRPIRSLARRGVGTGSHRAGCVGRGAWQGEFVGGQASPRHDSRFRRLACAAAPRRGSLARACDASFATAEGPPMCPRSAHLDRVPRECAPRAMREPCRADSAPRTLDAPTLGCKPSRLVARRTSANARGCSSVGRARPCQGRGRGFESGHPLQTMNEAGESRPRSSSATSRGKGSRSSTGHGTQVVKGAVCKTVMHRFESGPCLQIDRG